MYALNIISYMKLNWIECEDARVPSDFLINVKNSSSGFFIVFRLRR